MRGVQAIFGDKPAVEKSTHKSIAALNLNDASPSMKRVPGMFLDVSLSSAGPTGGQIECSLTGWFTLLVLEARLEEDLET